MFLGMLHRNFHYNFMVNGTKTDPHEIITYSVKRLLPLVDEVASSGDILLDPQTIKEWLPSCPNTKNQIEQDISAALIDLKSKLTNNLRMNSNVKNAQSLLVLLKKRCLNNQIHASLLWIVPFIH